MADKLCISAHSGDKPLGTMDIRHRGRSDDVTQCMYLCLSASSIRVLLTHNMYRFSNLFQSKIMNLNSGTTRVHVKIATILSFKTDICMPAEHL